MQDLFVKKDEEFSVYFWVAMDSKKSIFCDTEKESLVDLLLAMGKHVPDFTIEKYCATFRRPSFGDTMGLYDEIFKVSEDMELKFNPVISRYNKISALIKSWNLTGEENKPSSEEIRQLHPVVANALGIQIDSETGGMFS